MNLVDLIALGLIVAGAVSGYRSGALPQVFAWLGVAAFIVGAFIALPLAQPALQDLDPLIRGIVVLGVFLAAFVLGQAFGSLIGASIRDRLGRGFLGDLDRVAGALVGAAEGVLAIWLAAGLVGAIPDGSFQRQARDSVVLQQIQSHLPPAAAFTGRIGRLLDETGLPRLFIGIAPPRAPTSNPPPTDPQAQAIAHPAIASTVEVQSFACGQGFVGSGFVVGRGYVVTNAHVVAGGAGITAETGTDSADAIVVTFDPDLDVALLYVPDLDAPTLKLAARTPPNGTVAAALGHPGGRELTVVPASVTASYSAVGHDIYGDGTVTRSIIELRATVERGESGGPLMLADGTVGGVIFGGSVADPDVGYALAPADVATRIRVGLGNTTPVSTGACID